MVKINGKAHYLMWEKEIKRGNEVETIINVPSGL